MCLETYLIAQGNKDVLESAADRAYSKDQEQVDRSSTKVDTKFRSVEAARARLRRSANVIIEAADAVGCFT